MLSLTYRPSPAHPPDYPHMVLTPQEATLGNKDIKG
ncbi:hypothetical protein M2474_001312 [Dysgonomonas sp. PH5-37]|nr:hypothetical protein [Dysgonomonas sp. PH5-37]